MKSSEGHSYSTFIGVLLISVFSTTEIVIILFLIVTEQRTTTQGQVYYFHAQTGISSWHDPRVPRSV